VLDSWDCTIEIVVFRTIGARGGEQFVCEITRDDAAELGRALVNLYEDVEADFTDGMHPRKGVNW